MGEGGGGDYPAPPGMSECGGEEERDGEMEGLKRRDYQMNGDEKKAADALCLSEETSCFHQIT